MGWENSGYTGGIAEEELLGKVNTKEYFEQHPDIGTYVPFRDSVEYVKDSQFGDPENPRRFFPRSMLEALRGDEVLKEKVPEAVYKFFTAVGSHLDKRHSIDAFVECVPDPKHNTVIIRTTLDVTRNTGKAGGYKADIVVLVPHEGVDPKDENYPEFVDEYAAMIRAHILTELEKKGINKSVPQ